MKSPGSFQPSSFTLHPLLPRLWLHEPDAETIDRAVKELGLPAAEPAKLAQAYADLFLLNVPPYGTLFTDEWGELNAPEAQQAALTFEAHGYAPQELSEVGAPDHLGVWLGFMAYAEERRLEISDGGGLMEWAPVCCIAVEREPSAHPFYRGLAARTRQWLMADRRWVRADGRWHMADGDSPGSSVEPRRTISHAKRPSATRSGHTPYASLRDLVNYFLFPARCGMYLSRAGWGEIGRGLGLRLPFGSRYEVARALFESAGPSGQVGNVVAALRADVEAWAEAIEACVTSNPVWRAWREDWKARLDETDRVLREMDAVLSLPVEAEYGAAE